MIIRTVVADDDDDVRSALCAVIDDDPRFTVVGQAADGSGAVATVVAERPDVVMLDIRMPGGGEEAARAISEQCPLVTIIAVSAQVDGALIATLMRAGVRGVFVKGRLGRHFLDLVVGCHFGEVVLATPAATEALKIFTRVSN